MDNVCKLTFQCSAIVPISHKIQDSLKQGGCKAMINMTFNIDVKCNVNVGYSGCALSNPASSQAHHSNNLKQKIPTGRS